MLGFCLIGTAFNLIAGTSGSLKMFVAAADADDDDGSGVRGEESVDDWKLEGNCLQARDTFRGLSSDSSSLVDL